MLFFFKDKESFDKMLKSCEILTRQMEENDLQVLISNLIEIFETFFLVISRFYLSFYNYIYLKENI